MTTSAHSEVCGVHSECDVCWPDRPSRWAEKALDKGTWLWTFGVVIPALYGALGTLAWASVGVVLYSARYWAAQRRIALEAQMPYATCKACRQHCHSELCDRCLRALESLPMTTGEIIRGKTFHKDSPVPSLSDPPMRRRDPGLPPSLIEILERREITLEERTREKAAKWKRKS